MATEPGAEREFWERRAAAWDRRIEEMEQFSRAYGAPAMDLLAVRPGERIGDVGCGPGTTAIELSRRVAPDGRVIAVDVAPAMIDAARRRAESAGATGIEFLVSDVESGPVARDLDAIYSRFGLMFFPRPDVAFANLAASLRPGGRLAAAVWGELGDNPWMFVPTLAAVGVLGAELHLPGPGEPGPFSLAGADVLRSVLEGAGFVDVAIEDVHSARELHDRTVDDEVRTLLEVGPVSEAFQAADDAGRSDAVAAVVEAIGSFRDGEVWRLPGRAQIASARLPA
jgi:SAM-dependent methyltransferase